MKPFLNTLTVPLGLFRAFSVLALFFALLIPTSSSATVSQSQKDELVNYLVDAYSLVEPFAQQIVGLALKYARPHPGFPQVADILAVIAVESRFDPKAKLGPNLGLMQINSRFHKPSKGKTLWLPDENIRLGADLLEFCAEKRGPHAFYAYNKGPWAPLTKPDGYSRKVRLERAKLQAVLQQSL